MRYLSVIFLLVFSLNIIAQDSYVSSVNSFREVRNREFLTSETTPYCDPKAFTNFIKKIKSLRWYEINTDYKIVAKIRLTPNETFFDNPTFGSKEPTRSRKYGVLTFTWQGQEYSLNVYEIERVKNYIYVPFYDLTNYDDTYRGGRYVNISRPVNDATTIDFNVSYNPDCAYDECNICPIPPTENRLPFRVESGEKLIDRKVEKVKEAKVKEEKPAKVKEPKAEKVAEVKPEKVEKVKEPKPVKVEKPKEVTPEKVAEIKPENVKKPAKIETPKAEPIAGNFADYNGVRVAYQDQGKGKDVVIFIHGWTCNSEFWSGQMSAFSDKRLIAIDLPGHGKSDKPKADYTMDYFAKSIDAVMKKAGVKRAVLVGHSMGTPVIRQFYRLFPEKVSALVIVDGALRPFAPKAQLDQFMAPLKADYKTNAPLFMEGMLANIKDETIKTQIRTSSAATADYVALSAMEAMTDENLYKTDVINVPVLAILADASFGQQKDIEQFLRSMIPNLDYRLWQGASHFLMMENPQAFNQALRFFLNKNKL
jgi:pimeloyl-ACP methyl ester carboxylesterase